MNGEPLGINNTHDHALLPGANTAAVRDVEGCGFYEEACEPINEHFHAFGSIGGSGLTQCTDCMR